MKYYIFIFFVFFVFLEKTLAEDNKVKFLYQQDATITKYSKDKATQLLDYFNSLYPKNKLKLYEKYSKEDWETILSLQYEGALKAKHNKVAVQLSRALSIIYHRHTKFDLAIPYLNYTIKNVKFLEESQLNNMLERLEFSYSFIGDYKNAILIRKKRITEGFSNSFWQLYAAFNMYNEAINEFKSFETFPVDNDFKKIKYYNNLGKLFLKNNQVDSARSQFVKMENQAEFIIRENNYKGKSKYTEFVKEYFKYLAVSQQGECLLVENKHKEALHQLQKVIPYCDLINEEDQKLYKWLSIAKCYNALNQPDKALSYLKKLKIILNDKRILGLEIDWLYQYAKANRLKGELDLYNSYMNNYFVLKDSITFQNQKNSALLLLAKYDVSQKTERLLSEQEKTSYLEKDATNQKRILTLVTTGLVALLVIVFLIYKNYSQQKKAKEKLEKTNQKLKKYAENEAASSAKSEFLLQEMHHRIKNNLQMISSLLSLQKNTLTNLDSQEVLNDSKTRIKTMSLVHEQLYEIDNTSNTILMQSYLTNITKNILASYSFCSTFNVEIKAPFSLAIGNAMNIGLIVNEALTNTIKHNTAQKIQFTISLTLDKELYSLTINDNGKGFVEQKKKGFGLQLISILTTQLKGSLTTTSALNGGVCHKITIPKNNIS